MAKSKGKGKKAITKARSLPAKTLSAGQARSIKGGLKPGPKVPIKRDSYN